MQMQCEPWRLSLPAEGTASTGINRWSGLENVYPGNNKKVSARANACDKEEVPGEINRRHIRKAPSRLPISTFPKNSAGFTSNPIFKMNRRDALHRIAFLTGGVLSAQLTA